MRRLALGGHVGFDSLPDQLVNKEVNKGFDFNILCVGEWQICAQLSLFSLHWRSNWCNVRACVHAHICSCGSVCLCVMILTMVCVGYVAAVDLYRC